MGARERIYSLGHRRFLAIWCSERRHSVEMARSDGSRKYKTTDIRTRSLSWLVTKTLALSLAIHPEEIKRQPMLCRAKPKDMGHPPRFPKSRSPDMSPLRNASFSVAVYLNSWTSPFPVYSPGWTASVEPYVTSCVIYGFLDSLLRMFAMSPAAISAYYVHSQLASA